MASVSFVIYFLKGASPGHMRNFSQILEVFACPMKSFVRQELFNWFITSRESMMPVDELETFATRKPNSFPALFGIRETRSRKITRR
uniref:Uncharacterized protein n=1 Tax=Rhipicephalus zambeziensis TaxID=60191 RepID=A0A224YEG1_9ACAR